MTMPRFIVCTILLFCWNCTTTPKAAAPAQADLILFNGKIKTMAGNQVSALAAGNGRILALGDDAEIQALTGPGTHGIDLKGALVLPGFIEGHGHLKGMGWAKMNLWLMDIDSWEGIIENVAAAAQKAVPGQWITGRGWHQEKWTAEPAGAVNGYPTHQELSRVSPDNPVVLFHASGHALFANAKAMALAGIQDDTPNPPGGVIVRDGAGGAIGVFEETAEGLIIEAKRTAEAGRSPSETKALDKKALKLAIAECLHKGITSFQDAGSSFADMDLYKELADEGALHIRLWVMANSDNAALAEKLPAYGFKHYADNHLTLGGIKRYVDGALGSRGAWLLEPYLDLPDSHGQAVTGMEELRAAADLAKQHQLQLCIHAIGDRGNREVLNLYESVLEGQNLRWRIEHAQHLHPEDIPRFAQLKVIASMQGIHCTSDSPFVVKRLGETRAREGAYVWRQLLGSGAMVTAGTDVPVEDIDPLANLYAMVTRQRTGGQNFYPEERLTLEEALTCYLPNNAYAAFEEDLKGTLEVGKLADMVVLSKDITTGPPETLLETQVDTTIVGGKVLYQREPH